MKYLGAFFFIIISWSINAQEITLKKGIVLDGLKVNDTLAESFSLYLPTSFKIDKAWPVLFVFDLKGKGKQALSMYTTAAEEYGYIVAASNNIQDSLSITDNVLITNRMFNSVFSLLPIKKNRIYASGYSEGGRFATLVPAFIKGITGVLSFSSTIANEEILSARKPFYFIGVVGKNDYLYSEMIRTKKVLNRLKFPNQLIFHENGREWPPLESIKNALVYFDLAAMAKNTEKIDVSYVKKNYKNGLIKAGSLIAENKPLYSENVLSQMLIAYKPLVSIDSIKYNLKNLKRSKLYRSSYNEESALLLKEDFIKGEYNYYLEEDVFTYNYNNLGWWKYQTEEISKFLNSPKTVHKQLGARLQSYLEALIEDNVDIVNASTVIDEEALNFLYMLKTITSPSKYENYLKVISYSSKIEDYGTALFYLEELLSTGYSNKEELYTLEHTALFRISPEFNETVAKYLKEARYDVIEE